MIKLAKEQNKSCRYTGVKAFIKELTPYLPDPKPHYNSVATMVKILEAIPGKPPAYSVTDVKTDTRAPVRRNRIL